MRIRELTLCTNHLEEQFDFYSRILGIEVIGKRAGKFGLKIGESILHFIESKNFTPYHFAFNIPSNKETEALAWLKNKVSVLKDEDHEIIDFTAWNAKAMYFYDYDMNIVEFIARKNLKKDSDETFTSNSLIEISEIGTATQDLIEKHHFLTDTIGLSQYSGSPERFCAIGSENGLFICIDKNQKDWYPNSDKAFSSDFNIKIETENKLWNIEFKNDTFTLINA